MDIITANELLSGAVVYLDAEGNWDTDVHKARRFGDDEKAERDELVAKAKANNRLVGVELEKYEIVDGELTSKRLRDRIRAKGPTAPYDNRRQELGEDGHVSL